MKPLPPNPHLWQQQPSSPFRAPGRWGFWLASWLANTWRQVLRWEGSQGFPHILDAGIAAFLRRESSTWWYPQSLNKAAVFPMDWKWKRIKTTRLLLLYSFSITNMKSRRNPLHVSSVKSRIVAFSEGTIVFQRLAFTTSKPSKLSILWLPPLKCPALGKEWMAFCEESSLYLQCSFANMCSDHLSLLEQGYRFGSLLYRFTALGAPWNNSSGAIAFGCFWEFTTSFFMPPKAIPNAGAHALTLLHVSHMLFVSLDKNEVNLLSPLLYCFAGPKLPGISRKKCFCNLPSDDMQKDSCTHAQSQLVMHLKVIASHWGPITGTIFNPCLLDWSSLILLVLSCS